MYRIMLITSLFLSLLTIPAKADVCGTVVEQGTREPLIGASVILRTPEGKISKYTSTDADGHFAIDAPAASGYSLHVSMMGYAKQSIPLDSVAMPLTVTMHPEATMLKEVKVRADRIREQGDTITYRVGSFAQEQDRTIGDVLNRMPGIDVGSDGKIQYQGEDINRFYIEAATSSAANTAWPPTASATTTWAL